MGLVPAVWAAAATTTVAAYSCLQRCCYCFKLDAAADAAVRVYKILHLGELEVPTNHP